MKPYISVAPYLALFMCFSFNAKSQLINTIAGNGIAGFAGDTSAAISSTLNSPFAVAVDGTGNVYITDRHNNRIRKINTSGIINTIAGNGAAGYNGDSIAATNAQLNDPNGIAVDDSGNVYIADRLNNRVRKVSTTGIITTIAGTGTNGFSGDNALATLAELNNPRGLTTDTHGNVFIADQGNNRIRKINSVGIITTIAGTGTGGYNGDSISATTAELHNPYGIAVDTAGNLYIADVDNERIRKITTSTDIITTIAGNGTSGFYGDDGPSVNAQLSEPIGVSVDNLGNVFIADSYNERIREINTSGNINTIAGTGIAGFNGDGLFATIAELNGPTGVAISNTGAVYIADYNNNRIRYMEHATGASIIIDSSSLTIFPNPTNGSFTASLLSSIDEPVQLVITNVVDQLIKKVTTYTNKQITIEISAPSGIYFIKAITVHQQFNKKIILKK